MGSRETTALPMSSGVVQIDKHDQKRISHLHK